MASSATSAVTRSDCKRASFAANASGAKMPTRSSWNASAWNLVPAWRLTRLAGHLIRAPQTLTESATEQVRPVPPNDCCYVAIVP